MQALTQGSSLFRITEPSRVYSSLLVDQVATHQAVTRNPYFQLSALLELWMFLFPTFKFIGIIDALSSNLMHIGGFFMVQTYGSSIRRF